MRPVMRRQVFLGELVATAQAAQRPGDPDVPRGGDEILLTSLAGVIPGSPG
jgi:hypothetical protein